MQIDCARRQRSPQKGNFATGRTMQATTARRQTHSIHWPRRDKVDSGMVKRSTLSRQQANIGIAPAPRRICRICFARERQWEFVIRRTITYSGPSASLPLKCLTEISQSETQLTNNSFESDTSKLRTRGDRRTDACEAQITAHVSSRRRIF